MEILGHDTKNFSMSDEGTALAVAIIVSLVMFAVFFLFF